MAASPTNYSSYTDSPGEVLLRKYWSESASDPRVDSNHDGIHGSDLAEKVRAMSGESDSA